MATLDIGGHKVAVDDGFLQLPPEQQQATVDEIASSLPSQGSALGGYAKAAASGLGAGVAGLATAPQSLWDLGARGAEWAADKVLPTQFSQAMKDARQFVETNPNIKRHRASDIINSVEKVTGPSYEPQTTGEKYTKSIAEFLPAAVAGGGGSALGNALRYGAAPAVASEYAGQKVEGTDAEPWVRTGVALGAGGLAAALSRPANAARAMSQNMTGVSEQSIQLAKALMEDASTKGINLSWPQAIAQVDQGAAPLQRLQRFVERTPAGSQVTSEFYRGQPEAMGSAASRQFDSISPLNQNPSMVGPQASEAAQGTLDSVQRAINNHTRSFYQAAENQPVNLPTGNATPQIPERMTAAQYREMQSAPAQSSMPALDEAIKIARADPIVGPTLANMPDNAIGVIDAAQKVMRSMGDRARLDERFPYKESLIGGQRQQAIDTATRASPDYAYARSAQAQARQNYLEPLQAGPLGRIANADSTQGAVNALFAPKLAGGEGEISSAVGGMETNAPGSASSLIRQHLADQQNTATSDLVGGENYYGGARLAKALVGNPQAAKDLESAIKATPQGDAKWAGVERLAEILKATGKRLPEGSATATDLGMAESAKAMQGPIAKTLGIIGQPGKIVGSAIDETYGKWRYNKTGEDLARLLTDPSSADMLIKLSKLRAGSPMSSALANALIAGENSRGAGGRSSQ